HGEGRYVLDDKKTQVSLKYVKGDVCKFQNLEKNPNGSQNDIAGVMSYNGRVFGLMPHPERAMFVYQTPLWPRTKANLVRGRQTEKEGAGLQIFKNAINYFSAKGGSASGGKK
ncbi:MAG: phosphoribosylformylglycinamidine synthase subunit PurQ, partial [Patescibacteria group bacterium]